MTQAEKHRRYALSAIVFLASFLITSSIVFVSCSSSLPSASAGGWSLMTPGLTVIQTPCALIYIEVRANSEMTAFFWRIAVVPVTSRIPEKPPKKPIDT